MARETERPHRSAEPLAEEDVVAYLREHPDFLAQHTELLASLTPPSHDHGRGVVDFQAFVTDRLRSQVRALKERQRALVGTNLDTLNRIHAAVLFLLDSRTFAQLIHTVTTDFALLLDLEAVALVIDAVGLEEPQVHVSGVRIVEAGTTERLLGRNSLIIHREIKGNPLYYGSAARNVRSQALIRLSISEHAPEGFLAFASREPDSFGAVAETALIGFIARVVERAIRGRLDLPD